MRVCVIGGKLQGIEALYLAKKAGYRTILIDHHSEIPAKNLADEFYQLDIFDVLASNIIASSDVILPAVEKKDVLIKLEEYSKKYGIPYLHDNAAFNISSNKKTSEKLFKKTNVPYPRSFDLRNVHFAQSLIVKPACESGSVGITLVNNSQQLSEALNKLSRYKEDIVIQEFIEGPALSLELLGDGEVVFPLLVTALNFDEEFSCKEVYTPDELDPSVESKYLQYSTAVAKELKIKGVMDTQAIINKNKIPVMIEINARLPSQTPTVVYKSTGINILKILCQMFLEKKIPDIKVLKNKFVIYRHIKIEKDTLYFKGEHMIAEQRNLFLKSDFFGADEAITNICKDPCGMNGGAATLIFESNTLVGAKEKMRDTINKIIEAFQLKKVIDKNPLGHGNDPTYI